MIYSCITMSMMQVLSKIVTNCLVITVLRLQTNPLRLCLFVCPLLCFLVVYIQTYKLKNFRVIFCPRKETKVRQNKRIIVKSSPRSLLQLNSMTFQSNLDTTFNTKQTQVKSRCNGFHRYQTDPNQVTSIKTERVPSGPRARPTGAIRCNCPVPLQQGHTVGPTCIFIRLPSSATVQVQYNTVVF